MKRRGKKTLAWESTRRKLKVAFARAGITRCEFRAFIGCTDAYNLSFAHAVKRRFITTQTELEQVALACVNCHQKIEAMNHDIMAHLVRKAIALREIPVVIDSTKKPANT